MIRRHEPTGSYQPVPYDPDTLIVEPVRTDELCAEEYALLEERAELEQSERDEENRIAWEWVAQQSGAV